MSRVYDGLGRLIEVHRPYAEGLAPDRPLMRIERYYYDGVRRIQQIAGQETIQGDFSIAVSEGAWYTDREYLYGPDYVDEFVAQVANPAGVQPLVQYLLQDANYNVVAVLDDGVGQPPQTLAEYTYDPYGQPVYADEPGLTPSTWNTVAHQGLFFYRLDHKPNGQGGAISPLNPDTTGLYYNRNRWHSPRLGRFMQRDPNETAMPIINAMLMNAQSASTLLRALNPEGEFVDGMNFYAYQSANPLGGHDPSGLFIAVDDAVVGVAVIAFIIVSAGIMGEETGAFDSMRRGLRAGIMGLSAGATDLFLWGIDAMQRGGYATAETALGIAEFASASLSDLDRKARSYVVTTIAEHVAKITTGGPNNPWFDKWKNDIRNALYNVKKIAERIAKKAPARAAPWMRYIEQMERWLQNPFGGGPPTSPV